MSCRESDEREAREALRALRAAGPQDAPERVERALRAAFRARQRQRRWRMVWMPWVAGAAAAAAAAIALWTGHPAPVAPRTAPPAGPPAVMAALPPRPVETAGPPAPVRPVRVRRRAAPVARRAPERHFIALPGAPDPGSFGDLYVTRMELSRAALVAAGLPMNMERADQYVQADVVFAVDGRPSAIRILR